MVSIVPMRLHTHKWGSSRTTESSRQARIVIVMMTMH